MEIITNKYLWTINIFIEEIFCPNILVKNIFCLYIKEVAKPLTKKKGSCSGLGLELTQSILCSTEGSS
jgi:predicted transglutaminase-like protease